MPTLCSCGCGGDAGKCRENDRNKSLFLPQLPEAQESLNQEQAGEAPASPATPSAAPD